MYKVLLVEDEMLVRLGIKSIVDWSALGMVLVGDVSNGKEALEFFEEEEKCPDILITDINMPVMDGLKLIESVKAKNIPCKFIIITCLEEFEMARKAISLGVTEYLLKFDMTRESVEQMLIKLKGQLEQEITVPRIQKDTRKVPTMKEILQRTLLQPIFADEDPAAVLLENGYDVKNRQYITAVLCLDDYEMFREKMEDHNGQMVNNVLMNVLEELSGAFPITVAMHEEQDRYILFFFIKEANGKNISDSVHEFLEHVRDTIFLYFNTNTTYGVSSVSNQMEKLEELLKQSRYALKCRYFWGTDKIIYYEAATAQAILIKIQHQLQQFITDINPEQEVWQRAQQLIKENFIGEVELDSAFFLKQMYSIYQVIVEYYNIPDSAADTVAFLQSVSRCKCSNEVIKLYTEKIIKLVGDYNRNTAHSNEINIIINHIQKHYMDNLTLEGLSKIVGYSPNYLSVAFKKECGMNLFDYLNAYRIEMAKHLLETTNDFSYKIAIETGFSDESYFSRIFKKYTGYRPNEYRRSLRKKGL